jgi:phosphatidylinositol glycan class U
MLILPLSLLAYKFGGVGGVVDLMVYSVGWSLLIVSVSVDVLSDGSWDYFESVYGVILTIPDFTPNVGLFWYFFTEMFEHFRLFFLCVFQINAFIHSIPLTIRFSEHPVFLTYTLLSLISLFKSYPTVADLSLSLAFLPLWSHTFRYLRFLVVIIFCLIVTSVAGPIMWYLWIHSGSANANYYFGMTLTFSIAQIFLFLDVVHSYLTHEYDLYNGLPRINELGVPVQLKLD